MTNKLLQGIAITTLLLSYSCSLAPPYRRPEIEAPASWRIETDTHAACANLAWWKQLGDPVLDKLIEDALKNNQDLQVAVYRVKEFAARLQVVRSDLFPQISASAEAGRERSSTNFSPLIPGTSATNDVYSLLFNGSWELDLFGKIRNSTASALANLLASIENQRAVVLTLVSSVASSYIQLRQFDTQLSISEETKRSREESYRLAKIRFELGLTSFLQVDQALSEVQSAEVEISRLKIKIGLQEDLISFLIGQPSSSIKRGSMLDEMQMPPKVPTCIPSALITNRPDILQAEQELIGAYADIGVARANFFPDFSLTGALGKESIELSNFLSSPSTVWQYGLNLLQEIYTGGRLTGTLELAKSRKEELLHKYQSTILNAFKEVNDALISHQITLELAQTLKLQVATLTDYLRLSFLRYQEGQIDYLTFLDAERELFQAQLDLAQVKGESFTTLVNLYKSLGGGWVIEADRLVPNKE